MLVPVLPGRLAQPAPLYASISPGYIAAMKRILLSLLLAWVAIAPVLASSCAMRCELQVSAVEQPQETSASGMDCHDSDAGKDESGSPDMPGALMAAGCLLAATASAPSASVALWNVELATDHPAAIFPVPPSVSSAPPDKPPRA